MCFVWTSCLLRELIQFCFNLCIFNINFDYYSISIHSVSLLKKATLVRIRKPLIWKIYCNGSRISFLSRLLYLQFSRVFPFLFLRFSSSSSFFFFLLSFFFLLLDHMMDKALYKNEITISQRAWNLNRCMSYRFNFLRPISSPWACWRYWYCKWRLVHDIRRLSFSLKDKR